ncbi:MAG: uracil-DNA glycosylase [Candidatus Cloacimonadota bacterium]|nr:MAG: uracil-DNA glycosylase [Candidatus Cloacimonadota bacterium]
MNKKRINCIKCKYYKVTWEPERPHACTLFSFKSKIIPMYVVRKSGGQQCQGYILKK